MAYYIDTDSFETSSGLWIDTALSMIAPDGFYGFDGIYRQMQAGVLLPPTECPDCVTTTSTTTTTTSDCGCNKYTVFASQQDLDDATGNSNTALNGQLVVEYTDCLGIAREITLSEAGFWTNIVCIDNSTIIFLKYWKNNAQVLASFSYSVDGGIKCCVEGTTTSTTTTTTTTAAPTTTTTSTTTVSYSVLTLFLDSSTGTGFSSPSETCYSGSPFSVFINEPGYVDFQTAYNDGKALWTSPSFLSVYNGQNRWFRDLDGNAIQVGSDGFMIAIVPFLSLGCASTTTTTSTTTTSTTTTSTTTTSTTTTTTTTTAAPTTTSTTTTTTTTTTTLAPGNCSESTSYSGANGWPISKDVFLGPSTGSVTLQLRTYSLPDRALVKIAGNVIIDTGFVGSASYDFGGPVRNTFQSWLVGLVDPITMIAYPDLVNFPEDGYPRVISPLQPYNVTGTKSTADTIATVEVYGPAPTTVWDYILFCVGEAPPTSTTTSTTTTASPETFRYGTYSAPGGIVPIPGPGDINILSGTLGGDPDGTINIPFNSAVDDFLWFAIPSSKPLKTSWFVSVLNQGVIGGPVSQFGNLFPDPYTVTVGADEYKLYISNYRTQVVNMTISE